MSIRRDTHNNKEHVKSKDNRRNDDAKETAEDTKNNDTTKQLFELINKKKFIVNKYFVDIDNPDKYRYLELISKINYDILFLDLSHKNIDFYAINNEEEYTYKIQKVGKELLDLEDTKELYREIKLINESNLDLSYKKNIILDGSDNRTKIILSGVYSQAKRLTYPVKRIQYKLVITDNDCFCVIDRKNRIKPYFVKGYSRNEKNIYSILDVESFYETHDIHLDIQKLYFQLHDIFDTNHETHTIQIQEILDNKTDIVSKSMSVLKEKKITEEKLKSLYSVLNELKDSEMNHKKTLHSLEKTDPVNSSARIGKIHDSLNKIEQIRGKTLDSIMAHRIKLNYLMLSTDSLLYNNISMLKKIYENFKILDVLVNKY